MAPRRGNVRARCTETRATLRGSAACRLPVGRPFRRYFRVVTMMAPPVYPVPKRMVASAGLMKLIRST